MTLNFDPKKLDTPAKYKVVLIRHGESVWNKENKFAGWTDVDLSPLGIKEAHRSGKLLRQKGFNFDIAYVSYLKRAIRTLWIVLDEMNLMHIPVLHAWQLNERMYGGLQGLNKGETAEKHGEEQVKIWRRSYEIPPPPVSKTDPRFPGNDPMYKHIDPTKLPVAECLKDTVERFLPYWFDTIVPTIKQGKQVIVSAHGNSLRALVKYLDNIPEKEILELNIPTGVPLVYELDENMKPLQHYYMGDALEIEAAAKRVKLQGTLHGTTK